MVKEITLCGAFNSFTHVHKYECLPLVIDQSRVVFVLRELQVIKPA